MNNTTKIITAIAAAAAVGAVAGILFAPDKGSETRRKINKQGNQLADNVKNTWHKNKEKLIDLRENIGKAIKDKVEEFA